MFSSDMAMGMRRPPVKVTLESADGELFEVKRDVALQSEVVNRLMDKNGNERPINLSHVPSIILYQVIEYCTHHCTLIKSQDGLTKDEAERLDVEYLKDRYELDPNRLLEVARTANPHNLDIKNLFDMACRAISEMKNKERPEKPFEAEEQIKDEKKPVE